jgi:hypothetical protein
MQSHFMHGVVSKTLTREGAIRKKITLLGVCKQLFFLSIFASVNDCGTTIAHFQLVSTTSLLFRFILGT